MRKNQEIELDIIDVTSDGAGVGRYEGMAVFVPQTAIGDRALVRILKVKKTYCYGKLMEVIKPADCRVLPDCPVFSKCGGCSYRHITYKAEAELKENKVYECIKRIGGIDMKPKAIISGESIDGYRNKAQYPVSLCGKVGFYAFHSHRIIPCNDCALQPPFFKKMLEVTENWIEEHGVSIYDEEHHKGLLRHVYIRYAEKTDEVMFTAVINGEKLPFADALVEALRDVCQDKLKSVQLNINKENTNVILGQKSVVLWGEAFITDILCGVKVRLSPMSFYQVNRNMAGKLYEKAAEYAKPQGKKILDLYCGAGTIGLSMATTAENIIGVEIVPEAIEDAKFNAKQNGIENARFICSDATMAADSLSKEGIKPDVVIVDPPRKGCSPELIKVIAEKFSPERVVYVSCDPATLARDIKLFGELGYELKEYTPVDLFPRTSHVESVVCLTRK